MRHFMLLVLLLTGFTDQSHSELSDAWVHLKNNRFDEARQAIPDGTDTPTLLTLGFIHFAEGEESEAAAFWLEAMHQPAAFSIEQWEGTLFFLELVAQRNDLDEILLRTFQRILSFNGTMSPEQRRALRESVYRLAERQGEWEQAEEAAKQLGMIQTWQWVAGPFGRFGAADLVEPFGPENDLTASQWSLGGWTIPRIPITVPLRMGTLSLDDFLYPQTGVAYGFTQFQVESGGLARIHLECSDSVRLWLNGELLLHKDTGDLQLVKEQFIPCSLRQGTNWILVKSLKTTPGWNIRIRLQDIRSNAIAVQPAPTDAAPVPRRVDSVASPYPPELHEAEALKTWKQMIRDATDYPILLLHLWASAANYADWEKAEHAVGMLVQSATGFALAHRLEGETFLMQAEQRPGSLNRLERQAQESFELALRHSPQDAVSAAYAARYHISRRTWDQAKELVEACIQNRKEEGLTIPAILFLERGRVNREKGFWVEARSDLTRAVEGLPPRSFMMRPLVELLNQSQGEAAAFDLLKNIFDRCFSLRLMDLYLEQGKRVGRDDTTLFALEKGLEGYPTSRSLLLERARMEVRMENWEGALRWYRRLQEHRPQDPTPPAELADTDLLRLSTETNIERKSRLVTQAKERLEQVLRLAPESLRYRDMLRQLEVEQSTNPQLEIRKDWFTPFDVRVEDADEKGLARLPQERARAVYLIDSAVMEILPNGNARTLTHQAVLLKNKEGRERFAEISVPNRPGVRLLWARTHSPDRQQTYEPTSIQDLGATQALSMFNLEDGSVVDYAYEETLGFGQPPGRTFQDMTFYFGSPDEPMLLSRFVVVVPPGVPFHYSTHPADFQPEVQESEGRKVYLWERREVEGIKQERFQPPMSELVHTVRISTTPDFLAGQRSVRSHLLGRREKNEAIKSIASLLEFDLLTRPEKIDTVYDFVQRRIEQSALGGQTAYDTYYLASGSSFDRAIFAQALLEAMGIASEVAFSHDPRQYQGLPPIPGVNYFAGTTLWIPAEDASGAETPGHLRDRWINFDSRYQPPDEINPRISQSYAMVMRPGREFFAVPNTQQSPGAWIANEMDFLLNPNASARVEGRLVFFGGARSSLRQQMTNPDLRQRIIDLSIGRNLRGIQIDEVRVFGEEELEAHLAFAFKGSMPQMLRPMENRFHLTPVFEPAGMSDLVPDATREHPLEFTTWAKYMPYSISVQLPPGGDWTILEIPEDTILISEFGVYSLIFHLEGKILHITRSLIVPAQRISQEDYARFADFCCRVDAAEKRDVILGRRSEL